MELKEHKATTSPLALKAVNSGAELLGTMSKAAAKEFATFKDLPLGIIKGSTQESSIK